ncbi:hypothetical protein KBB06_03320 [Candidatus Gracilibacteria bacterium]|nr:hypothetical protein [Candidatus Gracilibacteria bacterium]
MNELPKKFYWQATTTSGGNLSLDVSFEGALSKSEKETSLAGAISQCQKFMENKGYIPLNAKLLSSRDIASEFGSTRQYWEKLLNEGKILYKETSAGRITTDLWVQGYMGNKEEVDKYVKNCRKALQVIREHGKKHAIIACPICGEQTFSFHVNEGGNTNGLCRSCNFYLTTIQ